MYQNQKGFTLIEMMFVLLIVTVLVLVTIPNITKYSKSVDDTGCSAYQKTVEAAVQAYKIDEKKPPASFDVLLEKKYLTEQPICPNGQSLQLTAEGKVITKE